MDKKSSSFHYDDLLAELSQIFRYHRNKLELTQEEMADSLGISRGTYRKLESGGHDPKLSYLYKLSVLTKQPLLSLLGCFDVPEEWHAHLPALASCVSGESQKQIMSLFAVTMDVLSDTEREAVSHYLIQSLSSGLSATPVSKSTSNTEERTNTCQLITQ
ncbi:helix-turn-helix transcriptional regulator [Vibrio splendidus]